MNTMPANERGRRFWPGPWPGRRAISRRPLRGCVTTVFNFKAPAPVYAGAGALNLGNYGASKMSVTGLLF